MVWDMEKVVESLIMHGWVMEQLNQILKKLSLESGLEENECKWFGTWSSLSGYEETESGCFGHG